MRKKSYYAGLYALYGTGFYVDYETGSKYFTTAFPKWKHLKTVWLLKPRNTT